MSKLEQLRAAARKAAAKKVTLSCEVDGSDFTFRMAGVLRSATASGLETLAGEVGGKVTETYMIGTVDVTDAGTMSTDLAPGFVALLTAAPTAPTDPAPPADGPAEGDIPGFSRNGTRTKATAGK